ncbi:MAG: hypothetical protein UX80_C0006G0038 [Candidatus Amesbacteria bacterium GW2011_GWA2_47_11b]|uniref:Uncharacterized protein n=3 Tax=Candidatus Amesiibacteriota TaxID=1752730 RepID=A0A0G1SI60_9BACT|nr:MAG: hypothetical protein UX42_C0003G0033 [Microgenomates group bacterium GW2011_GWC1_46_20]KKU58068.1 MAG: hypothetical protein UX80_C0006G0038 [Candidatus Amesbacteria bacterium GW2011_GWA2_47_11b]KKU69119.1 MAG: hypothetical protein UX92_C0014G0010 [Candidatus Amesbacteria bacterium GW2011_GWA1_47_20]KKU84031.1 MAG: hypothetical protein UY11_C0007G0010 [Candidatus Amesbacteria bacterium GW2011_GWC2_47_8]
MRDEQDPARVFGNSGGKDGNILSGQTPKPIFEIGILHVALGDAAIELAKIRSLSARLAFVCEQGIVALKSGLKPPCQDKEMVNHTLRLILILQEQLWPLRGKKHSEVCKPYQELGAPVLNGERVIPRDKSLNYIFNSLDTAFGTTFSQIYEAETTIAVTPSIYIADPKVRHLIDAALALSTEYCHPEQIEWGKLVPSFVIYGPDRKSITQLDGIIVPRSGKPIDLNRLFTSNIRWSVFEVKTPFRTRFTTSPGGPTKPLDAYVREFKHKLGRIALSKVGLTREFNFPERLVLYHPKGPYPSVTRALDLDPKFYKGWKADLEKMIQTWDSGDQRTKETRVLIKILKNHTL